jgi:ADP-ribose pyrophosphatase YjhB (NUDIX family)
VAELAYSYYTSEAGQSIQEEKMDTGHNHHHLQHPADSNWARFCPRCGGKLQERYVEEERHFRKICSECSFIFYLNPKVVAGAVPRQGDRIWLARRNIEPSCGSWTFPGGYVDLGERVPEAAIRETYEETLLRIRLDGLLNIYSYADVGIVLVVYRATVIGGEAGITPESQEVRAFSLNDIPWTSLAFPSTREALADYLKAEEKAIIERTIQ